jgi:hypothetical protein
MAVLLAEAAKKTEYGSKTQRSISPQRQGLSNRRPKWLAMNAGNHKKRRTAAEEFARLSIVKPIRSAVRGESKGLSASSGAFALRWDSILIR